MNYEETRAYLLRHISWNSKSWNVPQDFQKKFEVALRISNPQRYLKQKMESAYNNYDIGDKS